MGFNVVTHVVTGENPIEIYSGRESDTERSRDWGIHLENIPHFQSQGVNSHEKLGASRRK